MARGEIQYKEFSSSQNGNGAVAAPPSVPEELVRCLPGLPPLSKHRLGGDSLDGSTFPKPPQQLLLKTVSQYIK